MALNFLSFDEAAQKLGISGDRLTSLREAGQLRAYRDGASWKFRADEVEAMSAEGIPAEDSGLSDIGLADEKDAQADTELSDLALAGPDEPSDPSDSILLSETELGDSPDRPPSTIIGKSNGGASSEDDLELALDPDLDIEAAGAGSDVTLADDAGGEDQGVLEEAKTSFDEIDEVEIELEAESSRILDPEQAAAARRAAEEAASLSATDAMGSDLDIELSPTESGTDLPGSSPIEAAGDDVVISDSSTPLSGSSLDVEGDDEFVLGDSSDITLASSDSGINIVDPSDSGLALDDPSSLDLGGSAVESSLDLGEIGDAADEQLELETLEEVGDEEVKSDDDFLLTPLDESEAEAEEEDSSQIIALDSAADMEESASTLLGDAGDEEGGLAYDEALAVGAAGAVATVPDTTFSVPVNIFLVLCVMMMSLCGIMAWDLLRNIWSWDTPLQLNSPLIDAVNFW